MAQQQAIVTITGFVGNKPEQYNKNGMPHASRFRLASTRSYLDQRTQTWKDLPTTWITVKCYRNLSENVCQSLNKGDAAIVAGVLSTEVWANEHGEMRSRTVLEANSVGHDLNYGTTYLRRWSEKQRKNAQNQSQQDQPVEPDAINVANASTNFTNGPVPNANAVPVEIDIAEEEPVPVDGDDGDAGVCDTGVGSDTGVVGNDASSNEAVTDHAAAVNQVNAVMNPPDEYTRDEGPEF